jgi:hypothetical protein
MSKPAIIIVLAAAAIVLAVILPVFAHHEKRPVPAPAPAESQESITAPTSPVPTEEATKPLPPLPAPSWTGSRLPKPAEPAARERLDEGSLIAKLHDLAASDPPLSLKLAREAVVRFPDSPNAPEFEWDVVKALANMDRYKEAEEEARRMLEKYPDNPLSVDVEHHLLNHPPNPPRATDP